MRKMMNKVVGNMKVTVAKAAMLLKDKKGENYVDTAVKILKIGRAHVWNSSHSRKSRMPSSA